MRRTWQEAGPPLHQPPDILGMKAIDILHRVDRVQHTCRVESRRQRKLYQNAVYVLGLVKLGDELQKVVDRRIGRQTLEPAVDSQAAAGVSLVADVNFARRVVADQHRGQAGDDGVVFDEVGDLFCQLRLDFLRHAPCRPESSR